MARLKEITIIGLDAWCKVYLYTVLEERENPERRLIRSIYGKTTHSINLSENEDTFIEKMEQTGICLLDNREFLNKTIFLQSPNISATMRGKMNKLMIIYVIYLL